MSKRKMRKVRVIRTKDQLPAYEAPPPPQGKGGFSRLEALKAKRDDPNGVLARRFASASELGTEAELIFGDPTHCSQCKGLGCVMKDIPQFRAGQMFPVPCTNENCIAGILHQMVAWAKRKCKDDYNGN